MKTKQVSTSWSNGHTRMLFLNCTTLIQLYTVRCSNIQCMAVDTKNNLILVIKMLWIQVLYCLKLFYNGYLESRLNSKFEYWNFFIRISTTFFDCLSRRIRRHKKTKSRSTIFLPSIGVVCQVGLKLDSCISLSGKLNCPPQPHEGLAQSTQYRKGCGWEEVDLPERLPQVPDFSSTWQTMLIGCRNIVDNEKIFQK